MLMVGGSDALRLNQELLSSQVNLAAADGYIRVFPHAIGACTIGEQAEQIDFTAEAAPKSGTCYDGKYMDGKGATAQDGKVKWDCVGGGIAWSFGGTGSTECKAVATKYTGLFKAVKTANSCVKAANVGYLTANFIIPACKASATGDPHITTIWGEKLDLVKSGVSNLLNIPRGEHGSGVSLRLQVVVNPVKLEGCTYQFVTEVNIYGKWVTIDNEPVHLRFSAGELENPTPLYVAINGNQTLHKEFISLMPGSKITNLVSAKQNGFAVAIHGSKIDIDLVKNPLKQEFAHVQFLNVNVQGLKDMGVPLDSVGGVLGSDTVGTGIPAHCQKQNNLRTISTAVA